MPFPSPTLAYDLKLLPRRVDRHDAGNQGWIFGLPPGITPEQWPLDPANGYPLMHGFTLRLPDDYRVHGPEIVALSFFATAPEHNDGGPNVDSAMEAVVTGASPPEDLRYRPYWRSPEQIHPRLHRMTDILGCAYAAILLTRAEFDGPLCTPPDPLTVNLALDKLQKPLSGRLDDRGRIDATYAPTCPRPQWLTIGSAAVRSRDIAGELVENRALAIEPRDRDENAGKAPRQIYGDSPAETGYRNHYFWEGGIIKAENHREYDWAENHAPNHIGGTMRPVQGVPEMSPFYIEFEEEFGGYNFGGGNAQLDFKDMIFVWDCG